MSPILIMWEEQKEENPYKFNFSAVCKKGKVYIVEELQWRDGKSKEISRREGSLEKYLMLWKELWNYNIWDLKSITPEEVYSRVKIPEEDPWENYHTSGDFYEFIFRVKEKKHIFEVYLIDELKDKRYINILKKINKFVEITEIIIR